MVKGMPLAQHNNATVRMAPNDGVEIGLNLHSMITGCCLKQSLGQYRNCSPIEVLASLLYI